MDLDIGRKA